MVRYTLLSAAMVAASCAALAAGSLGVSAQEPTVGGTTNAITEGVWQGSQQDPAFVKAKEEFRVHLDSSGVPRIYSKPQDLGVVASETFAVTSTGPIGEHSLLTIGSAAHSELSTGYVDNVVEPEGGPSHDDKGDSYTDSYYWNFCGPGAAAVTIYYWQHDYVLDKNADYFTEPSYAAHQRTTYWENALADHDQNYVARFRAFIMYLAEQAQPPGWTPGVVHFSSTSWDATTYSGDLRDIVNWVADMHASGWQNFYYAYLTKSSLTKSALMQHATQTIGSDGRPMIAAVHTSSLGWSTDVTHSIAIVGYNDSTDQYQYVDTCGNACSYQHNSNGYIHWLDAADLWDGLVGITT